MKASFYSLLPVFIGFLFAICLYTCSCSGIKTHPEYKGVNPEVQSYVDEYKALAKIQGIVFENEVTIGFKSINDANVIGECYYGNGWREIDIQALWWMESSNTSRLALLWHELSHCYCGRGHDFEGKKYPEPDEIKKLAKENKLGGVGYYPDLCSKSIMFPIILLDECIKIHYNDYIKEMFRDCRPF
jgi:hypothetical protein